jgi:hypothetical protein
MKAELFILFSHTVFRVTVTRNTLKKKGQLTYGLTLRRFNLTTTVVAKQRYFLLAFTQSIFVKTVLLRFYFQ